MDIEELKETLIRLNIPCYLYSILEEKASINTFIFFQKIEGLFIVYYNKDNIKYHFKCFDSESEACKYFFKKLKLFI